MTAPTPEIAPQVASKLAAFVRHMAEYTPHTMIAQHGKTVCDDYDRAAELVRDLPHPRLADARRIAANARGNSDTIAERIAAGQWDDHMLVKAALAAFDLAARS